MSKNEGYWLWEISIDTSKAALGRFGEALLQTGAGLESGPHSRLIPGYPLGRGISAHLIVQIPEGKESEFKKIAKLEHMGPHPIRIQVGVDPPADDGHPGRLR